MQIPSWPISGNRELELIQQVLDSPQWGGFHEIVGTFEQQFASFHDAAHGISVSNGTASLEAALTALGIGPGDEVIVPAISFIASATAISRVGATPVFVDIEMKSFNLDPIRTALAVTAKTKAIMLVHFGGMMAQVDRFLELGRAFNIHIIEDAAHAHGSEWRGKKAGSLGTVGSFSFQNGKVMTAGEGGIVTTNDEELADKVRSFVNQGRRKSGESFYHHYSIGTNMRLTALQAAVLTAQLERLPEQIALRNRNAELLKKELSDIHPDVLEFQKGPEECSAQSYYLLTGWAKNRDEFCRKLTEAGIPSTPFYPHTLYENPIYIEPGNAIVNECPVAEEAVKGAFWLAHRALLGDEETTLQIAQKIREALA